MTTPMTEMEIEEARALCEEATSEAMRWPPAPWKPHEGDDGWGWLVGDGPDDDSADEDLGFCGFGDGDYDSDLAEHVAGLVARDARMSAIVPRLLAEVARLRSELGHVEPAEEPRARMVCTDDDSVCECCGQRIVNGSEVAMWFEEQRTVVAHWGTCPAIDRWVVEWNLPTPSRVIPRRAVFSSFEEAWVLAIRLRGCGQQRRLVTDIRLVRMRREVRRG